MLETIEHQTGQQPTASIIWLHGLGADGHDFEPVLPHLAWDGQPDIRYIFPNAPVRPVTVNNGMMMRAWYDIMGFDLSQREDSAGLKGSQRHVVELIDREIERGVDRSKILLAGFSQGGAVALYTGMRLDWQLAGIIALSCYLPLAEDTLAASSEQSRQTPIFMGHGDHDPVVPLMLGEMSRDKLTAAGVDVSWNTYPMAHSVSPDELVAIRKFLMKTFA